MTRRLSALTSVLVICLLGVVVLLVRMVMHWPEVPQRLMHGDNDDLMRLVTLRDWLGGQGWFDTTQYRLLPPEGVHMHWSRYVGAGIAAILVPASWVMPMAQAETAALALWPTLLGVLAVLVVGLGTGRLLGRAAAFGAVAMFLAWGKLYNEFAPARIDHHNVQILCGLVVLYLALLPGRPALRGVLAALAATSSLAVGLEMLPFLALVWLSVSVLHALGRAEAGPWLLGWGATVIVAMPLAMAGQVPRADWLVNHCDVLAPPVLLLALVGVTATMVPVLAGGRVRGAVARLGLMAGIALVGLVLIWPVFGPCASGPYAGIAPSTREIIETRIQEALPFITVMVKEPFRAAYMALPLLVILVASVLVLRRIRDWPETTARDAAIIAAAIAVTGLGFAFMQLRAINQAAPAVPLLTGFLFAAFARMERGDRLRAPAAFALVALVFLPGGIDHAARAFTTPPQIPGRDGPRESDQCRSTETMAALAALPAGSVIFSGLNLGAAILAYTPQSATSAPYHRSADAFWNGISALQDEERLHAAVVRSRADYLVVCRDSVVEMGAPFIRGIAEGAVPDWLHEAGRVGGQAIIFRVLAGEPGT
ncbi:MAG: hypothetical protein H3C51_00975 [Rubellimicrobium sp.]|nr:hypothetical protein [Rubellimicrobium sp.]